MITAEVNSTGTPAVVPGHHAQPDSNGVASVVVLLIVTALLVAAWLRRNNRLTQSRHRLPPGPRGWPILGSLPYLGTRPHEALIKLSRTYGPIMFMHWGCVPTLVVSSMDMAEQVLKANDQSMASRPDLAIIRYITYDAQDMIFSPYGDHWRNVRKICTLRLFTTARINQYQDIIQREVTEMLQAIYECQLTKPVVACHFLADMSSNIITQMMWGKRHCGIRSGKELAHDQSEDQAFTFKELTREASALGGAINIGDYVPVLRSPLMKVQGWDRRMKAWRRDFDSFVEKILEEHKHSKPLTENSDKVEDFVDLLFRHSEEKGSSFEEALSNDAIKGILMDMINGGTETTTTVLEWALTEVVRHPGVMTKAQNELKSVVASDRLVTTADIPNLKYLQAVIKETFRIHPPFPLGVPHKSIHDCLIAGYHIPAETIVIVNILAIQTDPAVWERPQEFDPSRFLGSSIEPRGQDFQLIPFSAGRRMCPAINLAMNSVSLNLANLLHAFNWSLPNDQKPEELDVRDTFGITTPKAIPLAVLAKPRLSHQVIYRGT